jgi:hypothetical protein
MKKILLLIAVCALTNVVWAGELSEADKKWSVVVEKMIAGGETTVSTPSESRAKLAKDLAAKQGKESTIEKTTAGYKVVIQGGKIAKN